MGTSDNDLLDAEVPFAELAVMPPKINVESLPLPREKETLDERKGRGKVAYQMSTPDKITTAFARVENHLGKSYNDQPNAEMTSANFAAKTPIITVEPLPLPRDKETLDVRRGRGKVGNQISAREKRRTAFARSESHRGKSDYDLPDAEMLSSDFAVQTPNITVDPLLLPREKVTLDGGKGGGKAGYEISAPENITSAFARSEIHMGKSDNDMPNTEMPSNNFAAKLPIITVDPLLLPREDVTLDGGRGGGKVGYLNSAPQSITTAHAGSEIHINKSDYDLPTTEMTSGNFAAKTPKLTIHPLLLPHEEITLDGGKGEGK
ncbi:unnamed protein product, partial [Dibothriocephalus latus]